MNTKVIHLFLKILVRALLILSVAMALLNLLVYSTYKETASPKFCLLCHMMKPEYYAWQASSHSQISCAVCHKLTGTEGYIASTKRLYLAVTGTYSDPIKNLTPITDQICEGCHNIRKRTVTPSGDIIIPHDVHKREKVSCIRCHRGITHGEISDRKVTYRSDYNKWDLSLGKTLMTEAFCRPKMDVCMRCHKSRGGPLDCRACHRTRMLPDSHKQKTFRNGGHSRLALENLRYCDSCHGYMSQAQYTEFQEQSVFSKFISGQSAGNKKSRQNSSDAQYRAAGAYAKTNDYCKKCHRVKPPSHDENFISSHGQRAKNSKGPCFVCHDDKVASTSNVRVGCSDCHPSAHYRDFTWKKYHPIKLETDQKVEKLCYQCHAVHACAKCHRGSDQGVARPVIKKPDNINIGVPAN